MVSYRVQKSFKWTIDAQYLMQVSLGRHVIAASQLVQDATESD